MNVVIGQVMELCGGPLLVISQMVNVQLDLNPVNLRRYLCSVYDPTLTLHQ